MSSKDGDERVELGGMSDGVGDDDSSEVDIVAVALNGINRAMAS